MGSVSESIATSARSFGAEIVTNASVKKILTKSKNMKIMFFYVLFCFCNLNESKSCKLIKNYVFIFYE